MTFPALKNLRLDGPEGHELLMETGEHQPVSRFSWFSGLTGRIQSALVPSPVVLRNRFYP